MDTSGVQTERIKDLQRKHPALADIIEHLEFEDLPQDSKARQPRNFSTQLSSTTSILMESYVTFGPQEECQRPGCSS